LIVENTLFDVTDGVRTADALAAHELYHYLEDRDPSLYTAQKHALALKIGRWERRCRIRCLAEIGAMAFAQTLIGLSCAACEFDVLMLAASDPHRALRLYQDIMTLWGGRRMRLLYLSAAGCTTLFVLAGIWIKRKHPKYTGKELLRLGEIPETAVMGGLIVLLAYFMWRRSTSIPPSLARTRTPTALSLASRRSAGLGLRGVADGVRKKGDRLRGYAGVYQFVRRAQGASLGRNHAGQSPSAGQEDHNLPHQYRRFGLPTYSKPVRTFPVFYVNLKIA